MKRKLASIFDINIASEPSGFLRLPRDPEPEKIDFDPQLLQNAFSDCDRDPIVFLGNDVYLTCLLNYKSSKKHIKFMNADPQMTV